MTLRKLVRDGNRLPLGARDVRRRRAVHRFRPLPCLVEHLGVERANGARVRLDVRGIDGRRRRGVEARLDEGCRRQHEQLRVILRFDLGVRHSGKELDLPADDDAADVTGRARQEDAIHRAGAPEPRAVAFPVFLLVGGSQLRDEETRVLEHTPREETAVEDRRLRCGQWLECLRVLERKPVGKRGLTFRWRTRDAVDIVGRVWADADVIEGPLGLRGSRADG